jgi:hypothetical protein
MCKEKRFVLAHGSEDWKVQNQAAVSGKGLMFCFNEVGKRRWTGMEERKGAELLFRCLTLPPNTSYRPYHLCTIMSAVTFQYGLCQEHTIFKPKHLLTRGYLFILLTTV